MQNLEIEIANSNKELSTLEQQVLAIEITDDKSSEEATAVVSVLSAKLKSTEEARTFFVKPLNDQVKDINARFKLQTSKLEEYIASIKKKIGAYVDEQDRIAKAEERRLAAIREKADAARLAAGKDVIAAPVREVAPVATMVSSAAGKAVTSKVWVHKLEHIDQLPPDVIKAIMAEAYTSGLIDKVLRKFVALGVREIPGVVITQETRVAVTAKR